MSSTKLQRWFDLIAFLSGRRRPVTVEQIMEAVPTYAEKYAAARDEPDEARRERTIATVRRMFERDKDELRKAGIPIETVAFSISFGNEELEGYRLATRDFYLPYIRLLKEAGEDGPSRDPSFEVREEDLGAALEGLDQVGRIPSFPLAREARSAFRKLTFDLAPGFSPPSPTLYLDPPGGPDPRETLEALSDALLRRKHVKFRYEGIRRDRATDRRVAPYGLLFRGSRWYLVGWDERRNGIRVFRVSRMGSVTVNAKTPKSVDYEVPAEFDLGYYADREAWELGDADERPLKVRVLFRFPRSLWAERNGYGEWVDDRDGGASVRRFEVRETEPFLRWLLPQGDEAVIELPAELRLKLGKLAERVAEVHGRGGAP